jgi:hypothetical protein
MTPPWAVSLVLTPDLKLPVELVTEKWRHMKLSPAVDQFLEAARRDGVAKESL